MRSLGGHTGAVNTVVLLPTQSSNKLGKSPVPVWHSYLIVIFQFHSELNWCSDEQSGPTSSCSLFPVMSSTFYVHISSLNNALICLCFMIIITAWCVKNYLINLPFKNMRYDYLRNKSIDSRNVRERTCILKKIHSFIKRCLSRVFTYQGEPCSQWIHRLQLQGVV